MCCTVLWALQNSAIYGGRKQTKKKCSHIYMQNWHMCEAFSSKSFACTKPKFLGISWECPRTFWKRPVSSFMLPAVARLQDASEASPVVCPLVIPPSVPNLGFLHVDVAFCMLRVHSCRVCYSLGGDETVFITHWGEPRNLYLRGRFHFQLAWRISCHRWATTCFRFIEIPRSDLTSNLTIQHT